MNKNEKKKNDLTKFLAPKENKKEDGKKKNNFYEKTDLELWVPLLVSFFSTIEYTVLNWITFNKDITHPNMRRII